MDGQTLAQWSLPAATLVYPLRPARLREYSRSELLTADEMLRRLQNGEALREDKVARIRQALAAENYETAEKIERAVDRLLNDLGADPQDADPAGE